MCVKFLPENLNPDFCLSYLTSTYTCGVTIALKVYSDNLQKIE